MAQEETIRRSQNSFSGGEIGSKVLGRVDLAKFNSGLRYAKNVFVEIEGAVSNRAGTEYGGACATSTGTIRFYPFEAPADVSYVIEMTHQKFRFIFNNALVLDAFDDPVEVVTPYLAAELPNLVFAQSNDIMTITHPNHDARELRRTAFNVFSLVVIGINPAITAPTVSIVDSAGSAAGEVEQAYKVSTVDAEGVESLASPLIIAENDLGTAGDFVTVGWNEVAGATGYVVYKRRAGNYGFMGFVRAEDSFSGATPTRTYRAIDNNVSPNTSQTPKTAENPFPVDNPANVFFFQQRRCFAASNSKPNSIVNSQIGVFDGFRRSIPAVPDDYFEFALGAARTQRIRHIVSLDDLLIFTSTQEWRLNTQNGYSATQPPDLKPQSSIGISDIPPLVVGTDVMYVPGSKRTVMRMNYSFDFNKFMSDDIGVLAKQMFKNRSLLGWCYAQEPHSVVFGYFDDGQGTFLTYSREQQVYGFCRFETLGAVDACTVIRENGIDRTYIAVRRKIGGSFVRFFERFAEREINNTAESFFVDCGKKFDDFIAISNIAGGVIETVGAHSLTENDPIRLYDIEGSTPDEQFNINSRYRADVTGTNTFTLKDFNTEVAIDIDDFEYHFGGKVRLMTDTITGLEHLNGETISALADGFVVEDLVVSGGSVTLPFLAGIRTAGIPYESEIHSLELEREEEPTRGRQKSTAALVMRVQDTRGIEVGLRPNKLRELKERDYEKLSDPINPGSEVVRVNIDAGWFPELQMIIRQRKPLPMTILSIIPEYTFGS